MIRFTVEDGKVVCVVEVSDRFGVYLDNDALIELSKGSAPRRERFLTALRQRGTLLFSLTNAAELAGPQGASADAVRSLLNAVGNNWVPLELNPWKVVEREGQGLLTRAPISDTFVTAYFQRRAHDLSPEGANVLDLSEHFFRLGAVLDWVHEDRDTIRDDAQEMDRTLKDNLAKARTAYEQDRRSFEHVFPPIPFDSRRPATFALRHLLRTLVLESKAHHFRRNDALDFCHAVLAAAYSSVATLDKQWKRRVENLPKPNGLAKIFYRPEVGPLVELLEQVVGSDRSGANTAV